MIVRRCVALLAVMLLLFVQLPVAFGSELDQSATAPPPTQPAGNLDLGSKARTIPAAGNFSSAILQLGAATRTVSPGDMLTAAEHAALQQVLNTGAQTLLLGHAGNAIGGQVNLTQLVSQTIHNMVVPRGVTAISDFGSGPMNILGNLTNSGNLYAMSSNAQVLSAVINASNIFNQAGAVISSAVPASLLQGLNNAVPNLNLVMQAINNIVNNGSIISSGNLSMIAGGSIVNAPAGPGAPLPVMQAMNTVNAQTANLVNSGIISSITGNINIATQMVSNITVQNSGGSLQALNGAINIRDPLFSSKADLKILGGELLSKELNLYSGKGLITVDVSEITGAVNIFAHEAHATTAGGVLNLHNIVLTGDPTFFNLGANGDVLINSNISTAGNALAIVANRNVSIGSNLTIDAAGGNILIVAGVQGTTNGGLSGTNDNATTLELNTASASGGDIVVGSGTTIKSNAVKGGLISLVAFANNQGQLGNVFLSTGTSVEARGDGVGTNGTVTMIAGGSGGITTNQINVKSTAQQPGPGGDIQLIAAAPVISGGAGCGSPPCVQIKDGAVINGGVLKEGTLTAAPINIIGALQADNSISIVTGDGLINILAPVSGKGLNLFTLSNGTLFVDAAVTSTAGNGDTVSVTTGTLDVDLGGSIEVQGSLADVTIAADTIDNAGLLSAKTTLKIQSFNGAGPLTITGKSGQIVGNPVTFSNFGDTLSVEQLSIGSNIIVAGTPHSVSIQTSDGPLVFSKALVTDGLSGSSISLTAMGGDLSVPTISTVGQANNNGGDISLFANNVVINGMLGNNSSLDASGGTGNTTGGIVFVGTTSSNPFVVEAAAGPNRTLGDILADGFNGGQIIMSNSGGLTVNGILSASGKAGQGGLIFLEGTSPYTISVANTGSILATNSNNDSGTIAINGGPNGKLFLNGSGTLSAGGSVKIGNINFLLQLGNPPLGIAILDPALAINGGLEITVLVQPLAVPFLSEALLSVPFASPQQVNLTTGGEGIQKIATDQTPVNEGDMQFAQKSLSQSVPGLTQAYVATELDVETFDANVIDTLRVQGWSIGQDTTDEFLVLDRGNILLMPRRDVAVKVAEGIVYVGEGSTVLIIETGNDMSVYDLHDPAKGSVRVVAGKKQITLAPGRQVTLTKDMNSPFELINPGSRIAYRNVRTHDMGDGVRAFTAEFSIPSAMMATRPLRNMLASKQRHDKYKAQQILRNAVLLTYTNPGAQPFKTGNTP